MAKRVSASRGFTLVELLVAMAISMLLVVLLFGVMSGIFGPYTRFNDSILRRSDGKLVVDQVVQDIEALLIPRMTGGEGLQISVTPKGVNKKVDDVWLKLLAAPPDSDPQGHAVAPRVVSHRLGYKSPIDGSTGARDDTYSLYRVVASAQKTFDAVLGQAAGEDTQKGYWQSRTADLTDPEAFLSGNVVSLAIRFLRADDGTWTEPDQEIFISGAGCKVRDGGATDWDQITAVEGGFRQAEVSITVLSQEGMSRLRNGGSFDDVVHQFGETTVRKTGLF